MSRTGARDRARRQLTETLSVLNDGATLLGKSRKLVEHIDTPDVAQYLADLDSFCARPFPAQVDQHPDNQAVDGFAAAMKTKLAKARAKGRHGWSESWVQDKQLAELLVGQIPKGNAGNFEDIANLAMMLHQRGADPMVLTLAFNKPKLGLTNACCRAQNGADATTIKERPILFTAPMVRAILSGQKTVTRRLMKVQPVLNGGFWEVYGAGWGKGITSVPVMPVHSLSSNCPYGRIGDRLWVREAWQADEQVNAVAPRELSHGEPIQYPADGASRQTGCSMITPGKTRPSIHMPRWVSRILLEITNVRVERLQEISLAQVQREGCEVRQFWLFGANNEEAQKIGASVFSGLWSSINGAESWNANPWVWVVEFKQVKL